MISVSLTEGVVRSDEIFEPVFAIAGMYSVSSGGSYRHPQSHPGHCGIKGLAVEHAL